MKLEDNIDEVAKRICDQVAAGIEKYLNVSGCGIDDLPEHFLQAYVLVGLGDVLTITMETGSTKLWQWNADARRRWAGQRTDSPVPSPPAKYNSAVGSQRTDLVIFRGDHTKKNEMDLLCLVEFKKWILSERDYRKMTAWLPFIDTCPYGIVCGFCESQLEGALADWGSTVRQSGDAWVLGQIARPLGVPESYSTFARVLNNHGYKGSAASLSSH